MRREIVRIDQDKCDGCGLCIPNCHEGALRIVDGKARLVADRLCDGMGACLGHCPKGAITIEQRECDAFDEQAVSVHLATAAPPAATTMPNRPPPTGCPSARFAQWGQCEDRPPADTVATTTPTELTHWPVQLRLLSPMAPVLSGARWLVAADCVPVACADFQQKLLRGRAVAIACPKLDDTRGYVEKLAEMMRVNQPTDVLVARMEVPCCGGILAAVLEARRLAASAVPVTDVVVSVRGEIIAQRSIAADVAA